jgi:hypothetical protein
MASTIAKGKLQDSDDSSGSDSLFSFSFLDTLSSFSCSEDESLRSTLWSIVRFVVSPP